MKLSPIIIFFAFVAPCFAQDSTPAPKKNPFAGFGNTSLDKRPNNPRIATPAPFVSSLPPRGSTSTGNLPSPGSIGLTFDAKTVANGGGITGATTVPGPIAPVKTETRASHPVLEVNVHNFSNEPANAHLDWFFLANAYNVGRYVWDQGDRDVSVLAGGAQTETLESRPVEQHTINETHIETTVTRMTDGTTRISQKPVSTQRHAGSQPVGWIVRMFVGGALVKVQASTAAFEQIGRDQAQLNALLKVKSTP